MWKTITASIIILFLFSACGSDQSLPSDIAVILPASEIIPVSYILPTPTVTPNSPAAVEPTLAPLPTITPTATAIPTPTWAVAGPEEVIAPILMYHHVDPEQSGSNRYNTSPEVFAAQMQALDDWGYTTITASQLVTAITQGAPLPPRPIVITFDDGHYSVYKYAFPIMQEHGFVGVTYVVANRLKSYGFTGPTQLEEMISAGWEVGSHSYSHLDLTQNHNEIFNEISNSRVILSEALSQDVVTFAYPYGAADNSVRARIGKWGYLAAMGLGTSYTHSRNTLYYLARIEIQNGYDLEKFASLLPWSSPPE